MIASLPMYAHPAHRGAHDRLWALIRDGLRGAGCAAPDNLDHDIDHLSAWARDDLVLSQICNLPYRLRFKDQLTLIGAADYGIEGCALGYYHSVFVTHPETAATGPADLQDARFVCNDTLSQSGYAAPQLWAIARGFQFRLTAQTGAHFDSITMVAEGRAELAAIDAQTWRMALALHPSARALKVIGKTDSSPGQSFVTRTAIDPALFRAIITAAIAALSPEDTRTLGLKAVIALPAAAYDLPLPPPAPSHV